MAVGVLNNDHRCTISRVLKLLQSEVGCCTAHGFEEIDNCLEEIEKCLEGFRQGEEGQSCQRAVGKGLIDAAVEVEGVIYAPCAL